MTKSPAIGLASFIEDQISDHFLRLHGYLQTSEQLLKNRLYEWNDNLRQNLNDFQNTLQKIELSLTDVHNQASAIKCFEGIDVPKLIERMNKYADSPCHILEHQELLSTIKFKINPIFDAVATHVELILPEEPLFELVGTSQLPEEFVLEPIPDDISSLDITSTDTIMVPETSSSSKSPISLNATETDNLNESFANTSTTFEKGTTERVMVTHINSPADFYVIRDRHIKDLEKIEKYIDNIAEEYPVPDKIEMNKIYMVESYVRDKWLRGRVGQGIEETSEGTNNESTYEVYFIDHGFIEEEMTIDRFRSINETDSKRLGNLPPAVLRCTLSEIAPINNIWDDETIDVFKQMVQGQQLMMRVLHSANNIYTVDLQKYNSSNKLVSLHDWLIDSEYAKPTTYYKLKRMNPLSAQHFYYEDLPLNEYSVVTICYVESPSCIYVKKELNGAFEDMIHEFNREYKEELKQRNLSILNPEYGTAVAVQDGENFWHRGIITKVITEKKEVQVLLVDYGSTVTCSYNKISCLPSRYCQCHAQAIKVCMCDILPIDGQNWSIDTANYLKINLEHKLVRVFPFEKTNELYKVHIYLVNNTNVNGHLVLNKYAMPTGNRPLEATSNRDIKLKRAEKKKEKDWEKKQRAKDISSNAVPVVQKSKAKNSHKEKEEPDEFNIRVKINKIINPDSIYVSIPRTDRDYQEMNKKLQKFYDKNAAKKWHGKLELNYHYCVYSVKDQQYHRAQWIAPSEEDPENKAKMLLHDIAEVEDIEIKHIEPLDIQFFAPPKRTFKIKLAGIAPVGGSNVWQSSSCQKLEEIINSSGENKYYITLVGDFKDGECIPVNLTVRCNITPGPLDPNRKESFSVAKRLIEAGLALPIRGYQETPQLSIELLKRLIIYHHGREDEASLQLNQEEILDISSSKVNGVNNTNNENDADVFIDSEGEIDNADKFDEKISSDFDSSYDKIPEKFTDWVPARHLPHRGFKACCTYVDFDGDVNFYPYSDNDTIEEMSRILCKHYDQRTMKEHDLGGWEKNDLCIIKYHADQKWYRGRVLDVEQPMRVRLVDYGNEEDVVLGELKKRIIPSVQKIPILSTKAKIAGIEPIHSEWDVTHLDVLHKLLVGHNGVAMKVIERPPKDWKVAIWIIEKKSAIPLPRYLKQNTQIECHTEDINQYFDDDMREVVDVMIKNMLNPSEVVEKLVKAERTNLLSFINYTVNRSDDSKKLVETILNEESSVDDDDDEDEDDYETTSEKDISHAKFNNKIEEYESCVSETLRTEIPFEEVTIKASMNLSSINNSLNLIKSRLNSESSTIKNDDHSSSEEMSDEIYNSEVVISGILSNNQFNRSLDMESVKSHVLNNDAIDEHLTTSTPLNNSIELNPDLPQYIDFYRYNVNHFRMFLTDLSPDFTMGGFIVDVPDPELNKWVKYCEKRQDEIQIEVEDQPSYKYGTGALCLAKHRNGFWCRARVIKTEFTNMGDRIEVELIDYGIIDRVYEHELFVIKEKWLNDPWMGFRFKLHNLKLNDSIPDAARVIEQFFDQVEYVHAVIKKHAPVMELELYSNKAHTNLAYQPLIDNKYLIPVDSKNGSGIY
ncbi:hypothetical protein TKK_0011404 [Trichogramma kaykai]|uniref:Tudor domain-containing protein n=1 Tax=Trichogramma kaykai TaxID=54128 RepID=A0ABD2WTD3_9HYME